MKCNLNNSYPSIGMNSSASRPVSKHSDQNIDAVTFRGSRNAQATTYSRKERFAAAWQAVKQEFKKPKVAVMMYTGTLGLVLAPLALVSLIFFPVAAPVLFPLAAGTSLFSAVALWQGFSVAKSAYHQEPADEAA